MYGIAAADNISIDVASLKRVNIAVNKPIPITGLWIRYPRPEPIEAHVWWKKMKRRFQKVESINVIVLYVAVVLTHTSSSSRLVRETSVISCEEA